MAHVTFSCASLLSSGGLRLHVFVGHFNFLSKQLVSSSDQVTESCRFWILGAFRLCSLQESMITSSDVHCSAELIFFFRMSWPLSLDGDNFWKIIFILDALYPHLPVEN